jgi:GrpB-like predicted nucleotidyltransferase (UPF0157 family)
MTTSQDPQQYIHRTAVDAEGNRIGRPVPQARTHHLHLIEDGHPHAVALVAFRDLLRADSGLRREYADLKDQLAGQHSGNRNAYSNAKGSFVAQALRRAGIEPPQRDLLPE